ncbi:hypothetical protein DSO57_1029537 [Entomophthora muscae]|uniref:Uncharacterized protein n=1 Tax=Entomophthora muscae TaxID=34485 RepID=A0ACC2T228_9FUNG|nr:hypothetical protein DSO57_1029537 [Entomophthora muscae]
MRAGGPAVHRPCGPGESRFQVLFLLLGLDFQRRRIVNPDNMHTPKLLMERGCDVGVNLNFAMTLPLLPTIKKGLSSYKQVYQIHNLRELPLCNPWLFMFHLTAPRLLVSQSANDDKGLYSYDVALVDTGCIHTKVANQTHLHYVPAMIVATSYKDTQKFVTHIITLK